jgi:hypothetical protein
MLDIFITSRVRRKIIVVFTRYPQLKAHVRALAKLVREDPGNCQRELKRLLAAGFLNAEKHRNTTLYSVNTKFILFKDLKNLVDRVYEQGNVKNQIHLNQGE